VFSQEELAVKDYGRIAIGEYVDGVAVAYKHGDLGLTPGLISRDGQTRWFPSCELWKFSDGLAPLEHHVFNGSFYESRTGVINRHGDWVIPPVYKTVSEYSEDRMFADSDDGVFLLDSTGTVISRWKEWCVAGRYNEGLAMMVEIEDDLSGRYGYIDVYGRAVIPIAYRSELLYDENGLCSESVMRILHHKSCGYVNKMNETVIPFIYEDGTRFSDGLAGVRLNNWCGYIDKQGSVVLPFEYDEVSPFSGGIACVKRNNRWGFIDRKGMVVIQFEYDGFGQYRCFIDNHICFKKDGKFGVMDMSCNVIIPPRYDALWSIHSGLFHFIIGDLTGVVDLVGSELRTDVAWGRSEEFMLG
jgi:hypothetical protein